MKKLMISLTIAMLTVTSFASTASARTSSGPEKLHRKYDFEPELQFVVAPLFSGTFGVAGGLAGALVAVQVCQPQESFGCLTESLIGLSVDGAAGAISGSMLSLKFTGGRHAVSYTHLRAHET